MSMKRVFLSLSLSNLLANSIVDVSELDSDSIIFNLDSVWYHFEVSDECLS